MSGNGLKDILQFAVQLNKDHQYALNVYTERLEAELEAVDKLLPIAEVEEEDSQFNIAGRIQVAGACKPMGVLSSTDMLSEDSPFYDDSTRRQRFLSFTEHHPMKPKEAESLSEAVRLENMRLRAFEAQRRGEHSFASQNSMEDLESTEGLDWERIATKVNTTSCTISQRSARECKIHWLGDRHPRFNHSSWAASDIAAAKALVEPLEGSDIDWVSIAEQLGTRRTPIDVMRHTITRKAHAWDAESDRRLVEAVQKYGTESWPLVARAVSEDAQINSCQNRWYRTLDPSIRRGNWSPEEDAQLRLAVELYGHAWMEVASVIPRRNNEQCRDRWGERLNPKVSKGKWTAEEDARLLSAVDEFGVKRWKEVSERVGGGRRDNACRSRYDSIKSRGSADIPCGSSGEQTVVPVSKRPSSSKPRQRNRKGTGRGLPSLSTGVDTHDTQRESTSRESQPQTSSDRTQATQAQSRESEMVVKDAAQPEVDSQPLPAGKSKSLRPRARPFKRAETQAHVTSSSPPQPKSMGETQPVASGAATLGIVESVHASPPTLEVENENSHTETPTVRVSRKRLKPASHQRNNANKRQKFLDQARSKAGETSNCFTDVNAAAEAAGVESSFLNNNNIDPALRGQANEEPRLPEVQSMARVDTSPKKRQQSRGKQATAPTRIQPKRSSRS